MTNLRCGKRVFAVANSVLRKDARMKVNGGGGGAVEGFYMIGMDSRWKDGRLSIWND